MNTIAILERPAVEDGFKVKAADGMIYGPVSLDTLLEWVRDGRVLPETWVHGQSLGAWRQAETLPDLAEALGEASQPEPAGEAAPGGQEAIGLEELRQFPRLARLSDDQLEQVRLFGELRVAPADSLIISKGDPGDALYLVLAGEVRVRLVIGGEDKTLVNIRAGQFFGEMALFNDAPRSADVVAVTETRLMRVTREAFRMFIEELPELGSPIVYQLATTMADRIVASNTRYQRDTAAEFLWR